MGEARVLEVRVHGIANAPPADMLVTEPDQVEKAEGDALGSFWRRKGADAAPPDGLAEYRVEAYSWGNQARTGGSALALIGRAFVHLGWLFVLPFALCNLAYWARRRIPGPTEKPGVWEGGPGATWIRIFALLQTLFYTAGFMSVSVDLVAVQCFSADPRLVCAALPQWIDGLETWNRVGRSALLSIFPIVVMTIIYLIGLRARGEYDPDRLDASSSAEEPAAVRFAVEAKDHQPPLLASKGFWRESRILQTTERAHFAGVIALVLFLLAYDAFVEATAGLRWSAPPAAADPVTGVLGLAASAYQWLEQASQVAPLQFWGVVIGGILLALTAAIVILGGMSGEKRSKEAKRAAATIVLAAAVVAYLLWLVWAVIFPHGDGEAGDDKFVGLEVTPGVLATICALIAVASLAWGYPVRQRISAVLVVLAFASVVLAEVVPHLVGTEAAEGWRIGLSVAAFSLVAIAVGVGYLFHSRAERAIRAQSGWHGNGAAVMLLLALFSSMVITSLLVIGVHAWLSTPAESPKNVQFWRQLPAPAPDVTATPLFPVLEPPDFYVRFAVALLAMLLIVVLIVGVVALFAFPRFPKFSVPALTFPDGTSSQRESQDQNLLGLEDLAAGVPPDSTPPGYPQFESKPDNRDRKIAAARRFAAFAHRGEPLLAAMAILTAVALVPLTVPLFAEGARRWEIWPQVTSASAWALGLLAVAAATYVIANAVTATERPLGLVWDIFCFFPRAGHPFTPPCYAERTVPELSGRIEKWLETTPAQDHYVIISAHSMGAPIAAATIFSMWAGRKPIDRLALLTYGVQLRAYFGRFFPEVFGPQVLGAPGTLRPHLVSPDPWAAQVRSEWGITTARQQRRAERRRDTAKRRDPASAPKRTLWERWLDWLDKVHRKATQPTPVRPTLVEALGGDFDTGELPRWRSLWRRTDYLGFPAAGYKSAGNLIDRGASERAPREYVWMIARHNDYLGTLQYDEARDELLAMWSMTAPSTVERE